MATVAEVNALLQANTNIIKAAVSSLSEIVRQESAINPAAPDAQAQLDALEKQYEIIRTRENVANAAAFAAYSAAFATLSPADKAIVNNGPIAAAYEAAVVSAEQNGKNRRSTVASKQAAINAAQAVKPTPTPTGNAVSATTAAGGSTNPLVGTADSDSGAPQASAPGTTPNSPAGPLGAGGTTAATATDNASAPPPSVPESNASSVLPPSPTGYQYLASSASTQQVATLSTPGKRLKNPLGEFPTYTYQISLYMITPDAYEAFIASGRTKIDVFNELTAGTGAGGAFLIAQSGGINNTNSKRMPGFEYDYGIDNLEMVNAINGKTTQDASVYGPQEITFQITEPYGFSFLTKIKEANDLISTYSGGAGNTPLDGANQFFILGIRFFGNNTSGVPATPTDTMSYNGTGSGLPNNNGTIDPLSQNGELFEHFYDIILRELKFKIDGKMTVYNISAVNAGRQAGFSVKRGTIRENTPITGTTVAEILDKLVAKMNGDQQLLADQGRIQFPNRCEILWMPGTQPIIDATVISPADVDKSRAPGSGATSTQEVTAATELQNQTASNGVAQTIQFGNDTNILAAITQVISQSSYINDALKVIYTTSLQSPAGANAPAEIDNTQTKRVSWFSCSAQIKTIKWDSIVNDWAYTIQYVIQKYDTPVVDSAYVYSGTSYPGAHKRYDYWYTGKNSEILQYEQVFDYAYFNVAMNPNEASGGANDTGSGRTPNSTPDTNVSGPQNTAIVPGLFTSQPRIGKTGYGMEATNNYITSLYDPGAYSTARFTILGDPDYLIQEPSFSDQIIYDAAYGSTGFNINPGGGQVFVEIDFKEAVDYTSQTGTLSINDSIKFQQYPDSVASKIKGICYMLISVTSKFRGGAFTQEILGNAPPFGGTRSNPATNDAGRPPENATPNAAGSGPTPGNTGQTSGNTGARVDTPYNTRTPTPTPTDTSNRTPATPVTMTGPGGQPVANGDGSRRG